MYNWSFFDIECEFLLKGGVEGRKRQRARKKREGKEPYNWILNAFWMNRWSSEECLHQRWSLSTANFSCLLQIMPNQTCYIKDQKFRITIVVHVLNEISRCVCVGGYSSQIESHLVWVLGLNPQHCKIIKNKYGKVEFLFAF